MLEYRREAKDSPGADSVAVKVIGIGGAGANVLDRMALEGIEGAELISMNTDVRALGTSVANTKVQLGKALTQGLAAGGDPELGAQAAEESQAEIRAIMQGNPIVFVCAGLGGGTGSGAAPLVAKIAREEGAFVVSFMTMPFSFEGRRRLEQAEATLRSLEVYSNALVTFDNDRMGDLVLPKEGVSAAFSAADQIISQSVRAVCNMVNQRGLVQVGLDDLLTALKSHESRCLFGYGQAKGDNRAQEAVARALKSPLLDKGALLKNAKNAIVQVSGGEGLTLYEVEILMKEVTKHLQENAQILFGLSADEKLGENVSVTIISSVSENEVKPEGKGGETGTKEKAAATAVAAATAPLVSTPEEPVTEPAPEEPTAKKPDAPLSVEEEAGPETAPEPEVAPEPVAAPVDEDVAELELDPEPEIALEPEPEPEPEPAPPLEPVTEEPAPESVEEAPALEPEPEVTPEEETDVVSELEELMMDDAVEEPPLVPPAERTETDEVVPDPAPKPEPEPAPIPAAAAKIPPPRKKPAPASEETVAVELPSTEAEPDPTGEEAHQEELIPKRKPSRGRFDKSEPTIIDGEDLDVPTFLRKK
ncbi:MAG: hypothetical protein AAGJ79_09270 [Verrucomicrobiota bacterium]